MSPKKTYFIFLYVLIQQKHTIPNNTSKAGVTPIKILGANQQLVDRINYFASNIENNTERFSDFDKELDMIKQAIFNGENDGRKTNYMIHKEKEKLFIIPMNPVMIDQESYKQEIIEKEEELFTWDTKNDNLLEEPIKVK